MNKLLSYCGLVGAKIRASDKDLPVHIFFLSDILKNTIEKKSRENLLGTNFASHVASERCSI